MQHGYIREKKNLYKVAIVTSCKSCTKHNLLLTNSVSELVAVLAQEGQIDVLQRCKQTTIWLAVLRRVKQKDLVE